MWTTEGTPLRQKHLAKKKKKCFVVESGRVRAERQDNCGKVSPSAEVYQTAQPSKPIMTPSNVPAAIRRGDRDQEPVAGAAGASATLCTRTVGQEVGLGHLEPFKSRTAQSCTQGL